MGLLLYTWHRVFDLYAYIHTSVSCICMLVYIPLFVGYVCLYTCRSSLGVYACMHVEVRWVCMLVYVTVSCLSMLANMQDFVDFICIHTAVCRLCMFVYIPASFVSVSWTHAITERPRSLSTSMPNGIIFALYTNHCQMIAKPECTQVITERLRFIINNINYFNVATGLPIKIFSHRWLCTRMKSILENLVS